MRIFGLIRATVRTLAWVTTFILLGIGAAASQNADQLSRSYLTPFPDNDQYHLYVIGDSLGEGLWSGLSDTLREDLQFQIFRKIHYGSALATTRADWAARLEEILRNETVHIAVIFTGAAERRNISHKNKKMYVGSEAWREHIAKRVDRLIKRLRRKRIATYWVGLPVMRAPKVNSQMQALNEVVRERVFLNGAKFIDTWNAFADQFGRYSAFGPDMTGNVQRLRADDGVHFTFRGNQKLAHFVQKEIFKDQALARTERNVPLAGNEKEQRRIHRKAVSKSPAPKNKDKTDDKSAPSAVWFSLVMEKNTKNATMASLGEIKILRPRLSEAAASGFSRNSSRANASLLAGEQIAKDVAGDITALGSISSANAISLQNIKPRVPLAQAPYYKVLIKGERLSPKPGRADDFTWPRSGGNPNKADSLRRQSRKPANSETIQNKGG